MNPKERMLFYIKTILYRTDPHIEDSVLQLERSTPKQEVADWEFFIEFPKESVELNVNR